ncbi:MAG: site-specific integrase [Myxococcales bacterium]|nr:site-specific integrase [Myxococcales bacterium]
MTAAIDEYISHKRVVGRPDGRPLRESTLTTLRYRLVAIHAGTSKLDELTPKRCAALYAARTQTKIAAAGDATIAADTHRNELQAAKTFAAWLHGRGWLPRNPWDQVQAVGGRLRGKEQLRVDEARRFSDVAFAAARAGDVAAIAVLTALILGLRSSEVLDRVIRDLDDDGRLLWIPTSKTDAGRRREEVPAELRRLLLELAGDRPGTDRLFPRLAQLRRRGRARDVVTSDWLRYHTARLCTAADVPRVCPHSLRGLHSTLAVEAGATPHLVAASLGHADRGGTARRHYIAPGALERQSTRRVAATLIDRSGVGNETSPTRSPSDSELEDSETNTA